MMKSHIFNQSRSSPWAKRGLISFLVAMSSIVVGEKALSVYAQQRLSALVDAMTITQEFQGLVFDSSGAGTFLLNAIERQGLFAVKSISIRSPLRKGQTFEAEFGERSSARHWPEKLEHFLSRFDLNASAASIEVRMIVELLPKVTTLLLGYSLILSLVSMWIYHAAQSRKATKIELLTARQVAGITRQVAHDIRSPLAALTVIEQEVRSLSDSSSKLLQSAILRIQEIASDLIHHATFRLNSNIKVICNLNELVENMIDEKRLEYRHRSDVELKLIRNDPSRALMNASNFCRSISNIINNSYDAIQAGGLIEIEMANHDSIGIITIRDNGKGIPPQVLSQVRKEGFSYEKRGGNGIGLSFASRFCEESGGELQIDSTLEKGTSVVLKLPLVAIASHDRVENYDGILIDDDPLIRAAWSHSAKSHHRKILTLSPNEDWEKMVQYVHKNTPIFIDQYLGEKHDGFEVAEKLSKQGYQDLHIVTAHFDMKTRSKPACIKTVNDKIPPWSKRQSSPSDRLRS